jgi:DNA repair exonuclease SbcCD ATPase subunit
LIINKINIENFRAFKKFEAEFNPGFNFIYGPNGSGKTSLLDAIAFAIHGATLDELKEKTLIHIGHSQSKVNIVLLNEEIMNISRSITKKKNGFIQSSKINGKIINLLDYQAKMNELFGDKEWFDTFLEVDQSNIYNILELSPQLFEKLLIKYSDSKSIMSVLESSLMLRKSIMNEKHIILRNINMTNNIFKEKKSYINDIQNMKMELGAITHDLNDIHEKIIVLENKKDNINSNILRIESNLSILQEINNEKNNVLSNLSILNIHLNKIKGVLSVSNKEIIQNDEINNIIKNINKILENLNLFNTSYDDEFKKLYKNIDEINIYYKKINDINKQKLENIFIELENNKSIETKILKKQIINDSYHSVIEGYVNEIGKYEKELKYYREELEKYENSEIALDIFSNIINILWQEEIKRMTRSLIMKANKYLKYLETSIKLSYRGGTLRAKIQGKFLPIESLSAGHRTLINLIIKICIIELTGNRQLLLLDDPFILMDSTFNSTFNKLVQLLKRIFKQIIVTSHHPNQYIEVNNEITLKYPVF